MMEALACVPLLFEPGSRWNYSVATDVVGRLVEVVSGLRLDQYFQAHLFEPLGMTDTSFVVPPEKAHRLATLYIGDLQEPTRPGLSRADHLPYPGAYLKPVARLNPGGGLVSTLGDYTRLVGAIARGGEPVLAPSTLPLLMQNQLPQGMWLQFPDQPVQNGVGHSFAGSVRVEASSDDISSLQGELAWGGLAGTQWFISPAEGLAAVLMTQRYMGTGLPFWPAFKQRVRAAMATRM
jgi:CubicO group peptidase (beta-lactamase class C family)